MRYLRLKLLKNKEEKNVIFFIITSKNIPCYVMSEVSLKRFYLLYYFDDGLTFKITLKLAFNHDFLIQTFQIYLICGSYRTVPLSPHGGNVYNLKNSECLPPRKRTATEP